jgi:hypothetical protein
MNLYNSIGHNWVAITISTDVMANRDSYNIIVGLFIEDMIINKPL